MKHIVNFSQANSEQIEAALSQQLEAIRLSQNITQTELARQAGVSRSTLTRLARGDTGISFDSFIRLMQALGLHGQLEALLPDPGISPLQRLKSKGKDRQRARSKKARSDKDSSQDWTWGTEEAKQ